MKYILLIMLFIPIYGKTQCTPVDASFTVSNFSPEIGEEITFTYNGALTQTCGWNLDFFGSSAVYDISGTFPVILSPNDVLSTFTFTQPGIQTIIFFVHSGDGCTATTSIDVNVVVNPNKPPIAVFEANNFNNCLGDSVLVKITEVPVPHPGFTLTNVAWYMGDFSPIINTSTLSINYLYNSPDVYYVSAVLTYADLLGDLFYVNATRQHSQNTNEMMRVFSGDPLFSINQTIVGPGVNTIDFVYMGNPFPDQVYQPGPSWWEYTLTLDGSTIYFNDGSVFLSSGDLMTTFVNLSVGTHEAKLSTIWKGVDCPSSNKIVFDVSQVPCDTCQSFRPDPGNRYWMSAWVKVNEPTQVKSYNPSNFDNALNLTPASLNDAFVELEFLGSGTAAQLFPMGNIIDGWQRVVGEFTIPTGTYDLGVNLYADDNYETFFDDIRIHPFNSSMKSYVYDGETFWLVSELDDNNYATFYEYDQEGGLVRIKKETERGIVTIQETRSNTTKKDN